MNEIKIKIKWLYHWCSYQYYSWIINREIAKFKKQYKEYGFRNIDSYTDEQVIDMCKQIKATRDNYLNN